MDTVDIKRLIYTASILLMSYLLVQLYTTIDQRPKIESVNYDSIQIPVINALSQSQPKASSNQGFDYKIIGTRIGVYGNNSSVVLKKNNIEHVVQIGEYLEGRYLLQSITTDQAIFLYAGEKIVIKTEIIP